MAYVHGQKALDKAWTGRSVRSSSSSQATRKTCIWFGRRRRSSQRRQQARSRRSTSRPAKHGQLFRSVTRKGGGPVSIRIHGRASQPGIAPRGPLGGARSSAQDRWRSSRRTIIMRGRLMNCGMVDGGIGREHHPRLLRGAHRHPFPERGGARRNSLLKSCTAQPITTRCRIRRRSSI